MLFSFCWILLLGVIGSQGPENVGTKVVTRRTFGLGSSEQTLYIMGDRRRIEFRNSVQRRDDDGSLKTVNELSHVFILRCDLGQSFVLRPKTQEYSSSAYPPKPRTAEEAEAHASEKPANIELAKPTLRIETTTVDTGERKELFEYVARHVITTRKQTPLEGSSSQRSDSTTDG